MAGDYKGYIVNAGFGTVSIGKGFSSPLVLSKSIVQNIEVVDSESKKSASSAVLRGAAGAALLGPVGLLAGLSAKNKSIITVSLEFNDGKRSLLEIDNKIYKALITALY